MSTCTAPVESCDAEGNETPVVEEPEPTCPDCGSTDQVNHWDTYQRNPYGWSAVRIQRYMCAHCDRTFTANLSGVKDGYRNPDAVCQLVVVLYAVIGVSCRSVQIICTVYHRIRLMFWPF